MRLRKPETRNAKRATMTRCRHAACASAAVASLLLCVAAQGPRVAAASLKIVTGQPGSVVFINDVRHGTTSEQSELELKLKPGSYTVRVRTVGFSDWKGSVSLTAAPRTLKVTQQPTSDEALLHYQRGEELRD